MGLSVGGMVVTSEREELGQREATKSSTRKQRGREGAFHFGNGERAYPTPFCVRNLECLWKGSEKRARGGIEPPLSDSPQDSTLLP